MILNRVKRMPLVINNELLPHPEKTQEDSESYRSERKADNYPVSVGDLTYSPAYLGFLTNPDRWSICCRLTLITPRPYLMLAASLIDEASSK